MNGNSEYWNNINFGDTLDERFLYILCSDYEGHEDMLINNEVDTEFYKERLDSLLKTKRSQLEKLIQVHANEIIEHRKLFYQNVDLKYANRKYSTVNTLSSMILHPEVEKILKNGRLMNPSQHGITGQRQGKIGTKENVEDIIKKKLAIKDDEPIIGRDELYRQYYAELGQHKELQEKELRDFLSFYESEQEYFEKCMIKAKKHDETVLPNTSFSKSNSMKFRAEYNARSRSSMQDGGKIPLDKPKKSKVSFIDLDSGQSSSSSSIHESTSGERSFDSNTYSTPIPLSNMNRQGPKTVSIDMDEQQTPAYSFNLSPLNSTTNIPDNNTLSPCRPPLPPLPPLPSLPPPPSPKLQSPTVDNTGNTNNLLNNLNPGAIQILNMLGNTIQQQGNFNMNEVLKFTEKLFNNNGQESFQ